MLANGREHWSAGERAYVYRRAQGRAGLWQGDDPAADADAALSGSRVDPRDYDVEHYVRQLQTSFASRLARGLAPKISRPSWPIRTAPPSFNAASPTAAPSSPSCSNHKAARDRANREPGSRGGRETHFMFGGPNMKCLPLERAQRTRGWPDASR